MVLALHPVLPINGAPHVRSASEGVPRSRTFVACVRVLRVHVQTFKLSIDESQISEGQDKLLININI